MSDQESERPYLAPLRAAASQAEFAEAVRGRPSADGYPLTKDDPLTPLARDAARTLAGAGFTLHHFDRHDRLWRPGGVCPAQIPAGSGTGRNAIAASQTNCDLPPGSDGHATCSHTCQLVTAVPGSVPHAAGYLDRQRSTGAARLAASHRGQRTEAAR